MSAIVHFLVSEGRLYIGEIIPFVASSLSLDFSQAKNSQYIPLMF